MSGIYTTIGDVRGCCGTHHTSIEDAEACIARDQAGCKMQGGYSDRVVVTLADEWVPPEDATHYIRDDSGEVPVRADSDAWAKELAETGDYCNPEVCNAEGELV